MNKDSLKESSVFQQLWKAKLEADRKLFRKYYLPSHKRLTMFCVGMIKELDLAENAATDVLMKLLAYDKIEEIQNVDSWLFTVARNECLNFINKESRRKEIRDNLEPTRETFQKEEAVSRLAEQNINKIIKETLVERDLKIWQLHLEGFRNDEIGEKLEMTEKTVANRKSDIRKQLQVALKDLANG